MGINHRVVLDSRLEWAQPGYNERRWDPGAEVWAFSPVQGVAPEERRWYRARVIDHLGAYVKVHFIEGRPDLPLSYQLVGTDCVLFQANVRDDLGDLACPT